MRWFATGQRVKRYEAFESAHIFAAGYAVADNGIDIINGWWCLRLPNWSYEWSGLHQEFRMGQKLLLWSRARGFQIGYDFEGSA